MPGIYIGFDLGTSTIKAVEVSRKGKEAEITGAYILPAPNEAMQDGIIIDYGEISQQVMKVYESGSFSRSPIAIALKGSKVILKRARVPFVNEELLNENLLFMAEQYMSIDPEEYSVDSNILEIDTTTAEAQVLFTASPHDNLSDYISVFESAELELKNVSVESLALVELYKFMALPDTGTALILHIGHSSVLMVFVRDNSFHYHDTGMATGAYCSEMLTNRGSISPNNVEDVKTHIDNWPEGEEAKKIILENYIPELIRDVETAINHYILVGGRLPEHIYISGGGATTYGIDEIFPKHFEVECSVMDPSEHLKIIHPVAKQIMELKPAVMNIAIAMSLG